MREDGTDEAALTHPFQVRDRRARAGKHHQRGVREVAGIGDEDDVEVGLEAERVDVGEVADPRQPYDSHLVRTTSRTTPLEVESVLGVQPQRRIPREYAEHRAPGQR